MNLQYLYRSVVTLQLEKKGYKHECFQLALETNKTFTTIFVRFYVIVASYKIAYAKS